MNLWASMLKDANRPPSRVADTDRRGDRVDDCTRRREDTRTVDDIEDEETQEEKTCK